MGYRMEHNNEVRVSDIKKEGRRNAENGVGGWNTNNTNQMSKLMGSIRRGFHSTIASNLVRPPRKH